MPAPVTEPTTFLTAFPAAEVTPSGEAAPESEPADPESAGEGAGARSTGALGMTGAGGAAGAGRGAAGGTALGGADGADGFKVSWTAFTVDRTVSVVSPISVADAGGAVKSEAIRTALTLTRRAIL
ncbi:MAG TPA: hypothetical protein VNP96_10850 [Solirubrobacterales bacterium]|nr:hypothetical protein [Solirubrobacterales bacterium]